MRLVLKIPRIDLEKFREFLIKKRELQFNLYLFLQDFLAYQFSEILGSRKIFLMFSILGISFSVLKISNTR